MVIFLGGKDPRTDSDFLAVEPTAGGWGGFAANDGQDGLINNVNGGFKDLPVEVYENKFPIMIHRYGLRINSGGAGKSRGGCGIYREYTLEADGWTSLWFERSVTTPWGIFGGKGGVGPKITITSEEEEITDILKVNGKPLTNGTVVLLETAGGGGYGNPWERDPELVQRDVRNGYVSVDGAADDYGVVLDNNLDVNEAATLAKRTLLAGASILNNS